MGQHSLVLKEKTKNIFFILLGTFISSVGINMFLVHAKLLSGGATGISLIIQYLTKFPSGYTVFLLNLPLILISFKMINFRFTILTVLGTLSLSFFLIVTHSFRNIIMINDPLLLCIYGGVLNGLGIGIVFGNHGSTGGVDVISVIVKKKYDNFDIGNISFVVNFIIVILGAVFFSLYSALYTLISMFATSFMIDRTIKGFSGKKKMILIITSKDEEVCSKIMSELKRGVTFLYGQGAYTKQDKKVLYTIVYLTQLPQLKFIVNEVDKNAFISVLDVSEVEGKGFMNDLF